MATPEETFMAIDFITNMGRLPRNMQRNARQYKTASGRGGVDFARLSDRITEDAVQFIRRSDWVKELTDDPARRLKLQNGLAAIGFDSLAEAITTNSSIRTAATGLQNANKRNKLEVDSAADAMAAAIPDFDGVTNGRNMDR